MLFGRKRKKCAYDRENQKPVIRSSICTREQVAGFVDNATGHFAEVQLIRSPGDLEAFRRRYGIPPDYVLEKIY